MITINRELVGMTLLDIPETFLSCRAKRDRHQSAALSSSFFTAATLISLATCTVHTGQRSYAWISTTQVIYLCYVRDENVYNYIQ